MDPEDKNFDVAYYIPHRIPQFTFYLHRSANAWWLDASKVYRLLDAFDKYNANIQEACDAAGITLKQYKYFAGQHPMISERRYASRFESDMETKMFLASQAETSEGALRWLRFSEPDEFDLRYRGEYARLKRKYGITAKYLEESRRPKTPGEKTQEMLAAVEKNMSTPIPKERFFEEG